MNLKFFKNSLRFLVPVTLLVLPFLITTNTDASPGVTVHHCGVISSAGTYILDNNNGNFSQTGACFTIVSEGVIIDGQGITLAGDIVADGTLSHPYGFEFEIQNTTVTGNISIQGDSGNGGENSSVDFSNGSVNAGTVTGNAKFSDTSYNTGTINGVTTYNYASGDGTSAETAYQIDSWAALTGMRYYIASGVYYKLTANLDQNTSGYSGIGDNWVPIGDNNGNPFQGNFDGGGYTISNLTINSSHDSSGLFAASVGNISNVGLIDVNISGSYYYIGSLVGDQTDGTITNSYSTGTITASGTVGGLVGGLDGGSITNSYSTASVNGGSQIGGLTGWQGGGTITNSYSAGSVTGGNFAGGIVGDQSSGSIDNSYSTGSVSGDDQVGGLIGSQDSSNSTVINSYSTGSVSGTNYVGGLVGIQSSGSISNSYSTGSVSGSSDVAGLVGRQQSNGIISNSFFDITTSGQSVMCGGNSGLGCDDTYGKTTSDMKKLYSFNSFTGANWTINGGGAGNGNDNGYPYIAYNSDHSAYEWYIQNNSATPFAGGDGTSAETAYQIDSWTALNAMRYHLASGVYYKLTANLDQNTSDYSGIGDNWIPIGTCGLNAECYSQDYSYIFQSNFDGNGYTITGLTVSGYDNYVGLFGATRGDISNVGLINENVSGAANVGALTGGQYGGSITNSYSTGSVSGSGYDVGGLVGWQNEGSISNSYSTSNVSGSSNEVGGLVGGQSDGTIENSYSTGSVSGVSGVGGLVGIQSNTGSITNSYSTGSVSGFEFIGGLVGLQGNSNSTITNSYSTGSVSGSNTFGGLVGYQGGGTISNSFWDKITSVQSLMCGTASGSGCDDTKGLTDNNMKTMVPFADAGWDIGGGYYDLNNGYPYLAWQGVSGQSVWLTPSSPGAIADCGVTISIPGTYTLSDNISSEGSCITIASDDVILDGGSYALTYDSDGNQNNGTEYGIYVSGDHTGITITGFTGGIIKNYYNGSAIGASGTAGFNSITLGDIGYDLFSDSGTYDVAGDIQVGNISGIFANNFGGSITVGGNIIIGNVADFALGAGSITVGGNISTGSVGDYFAAGPTITTTGNIQTNDISGIFAAGSTVTASGGIQTGELGHSFAYNSSVSTYNSNAGTYGDIYINGGVGADVGGDFAYQENGGATIVSAHDITVGGNIIACSNNCNGRNAGNFASGGATVNANNINLGDVGSNNNGYGYFAEISTVNATGYVTTGDIAYEFANGSTVTVGGDITVGDVYDFASNGGSSGSYVTSGGNIITGAITGTFDYNSTVSTYNSSAGTYGDITINGNIGAVEGWGGVFAHEAAIVDAHNISINGDIVFSSDRGIFALNGSTVTTHTNSDNVGNITISGHASYFTKNSTVSASGDISIGQIYGEFSAFATDNSNVTALNITAGNIDSNFVYASTVTASGDININTLVGYLATNSSSVTGNGINVGTYNSDEIIDSMSTVTIVNPAKSLTFSYWQSNAGTINGNALFTSSNNDNNGTINGILTVSTGSTFDLSNQIIGSASSVVFTDDTFVDLYGADSALSGTYITFTSSSPTITVGDPNNDQSQSYWSVDTSNWSFPNGLPVWNFYGISTVDNSATLDLKNGSVMFNHDSQIQPGSTVANGTITFVGDGSNHNNGNVGTIDNATVNFNGDSYNNGITDNSTVYFNDFSNNLSTVNGDATFTQGTYNFVDTTDTDFINPQMGTVTGTVHFIPTQNGNILTFNIGSEGGGNSACNGNQCVWTGDTSNWSFGNGNGSVVPTWNFYGDSVLDSSGAITVPSYGFLNFYDTSANNGSVVGDEHVYYPNTKPFPGNITGTIHYHGFDFYFNDSPSACGGDSVCGTGNGNWNYVANWWIDETFTQHASVVPNENFDVTIYGALQKSIDSDTGLNVVTTNSAPSSVAVSGGYAYVVNADGSTLQSFSIDNGFLSSSPIDEVSTGSGPQSVAVDGGYVYEVNINDNTLQSYSTVNGELTLVDSIAVDGSPRSVAVSGGYVYVANSNDNSIVQSFSVSDGHFTAINSVSTGWQFEPYSVAVSGNYLYVANYGSGTVQSFSLNSGEISTSPISTVSTGEWSYPTSVAVSGNYLYVTNSGNGTISSYSLSSGVISSSPIDSTPTSNNSPWSVAVSGGRAYVVNLANILQSFGVNNGIFSSSPISDISSGLSSPYSVAVDGDYVYVTNSTSGMLQSFHTQNGLLSSYTGTPVDAVANSVTFADGAINYIPITVTNGATFLGSSINYGSIIGDATFIGEDASATFGTVSGTIKRVFNNGDVTTYHDYTTESGRNDWIVVAQNVVVDLTHAIYSRIYNIFQALGNGWFISGTSTENDTGSVVPIITITSPTFGTNAKWAPVIDLGSSTDCWYKFDGDANYTTLNGCTAPITAAIPRPTAGAHTLWIRGMDSVGNQTEKTVSFTYDNTLPTYTTCGADQMDEATRPYYYLQGNVTGNCTVTYSGAELRGAQSTTTVAYRVTGNLLASGYNLTLKNIAIQGTVASALTTIATSTVSGTTTASGNLTVTNSAVADISAGGNNVSLSNTTVNGSVTGAITTIATSTVSATTTASGAVTVNNSAVATISAGSNNVNLNNSTVAGNLSAGNAVVASSTVTGDVVSTNSNLYINNIQLSSVTNSGPTSVAVSGGYAYVANSSNNTLKSFTITNGTLSSTPVSTVTTGIDPYSVAVSGGYAYVVNAEDSTLQSFTITNGALSSTPVSTVTTGSHPQSVAVSGGYAYVANRGNNTIASYSITNGVLSSTPLSTVSSGIGTPFSITTSGDYAYVANWGNSTIASYSITNGVLSSAPVSTVSTGSSSGPYSITTSGNYAYVVNRSNNTLKSFAITNGTLSSSPASTVTTGNYPQSVAVYGGYAYVVNGNSNTLQSFSITNGVLSSTPVSTVSTGSNSQPIFVTVSGGYVYVANPGAGRVTSFAINAYPGTTFNEDNSNIVSGTITGALTRVYTANASSTHNFVTEGNRNNWTVVANGSGAITVDLSGATYDRSTDIFQALNNATFVTNSSIDAGASVVPVITTTLPTAGVNSKWLPNITWGSGSKVATTCEYKFDSDSYSTVTCANNGSDIPRPAVGSHTLWLKATDAHGDISEKSIAFSYVNNVPTYTTCGADLMDEPTRPYYYLASDVTGNCTITYNNAILRGANATSSPAFTLTGTITGAGLNYTLRNINVTGTISSSATTAGASAGNITISSSTVAVVSANGASGSAGVGGGNGGTITIATSTTATVSANGGSVSANNSSTIRNGGNGGTITIRYSSATASSTVVSASGGSSSVCGNGGNGGTVTVIDSDDYTPSVSAGSGHSCSNPNQGGSSGGQGTGQVVTVDQSPHYVPPAPPAPPPAPVTPPAGGGSTGGGNTFFSFGSPTSTPFVIPVAPINPLKLAPLPIFGGTSTNAFTFEGLIDNFIFAPLPQSLTVKLGSQLTKYFAKVGLKTQQDLLLIKNKPLSLPIPKANKDIPDGLLMVTQDGKSVSLYATRDDRNLFEQATVTASSSLTISLYPTTKGTVTAIFNGIKYTFAKVGKTSLLSLSLQAPSPGTYTLSSNGSPLPLLLKVIPPAKPVTPVEKVKKQSVWSVLKFW